MANEGGIYDWFAQFNSLLRTLLGLAIVGILTVAGWFGYTTYYSGDLAKRELTDVRAQLEDRDRKLAEQESQLRASEGTIEEQRQEIATQGATIREQEEQITHLSAENRRLDLALRLMKVDRRLARITVLDQGRDPETDEEFTQIEFVELDEQGEPIEAPRQFRIRGDMVFVEYWVVKFEDKYVESADLHRAASISLFRRLFGEQQKPADGYVLDEVGQRPRIYARGAELSEFEQKIWQDFWQIANDPERAKALGIRTIHSEAPGIKLRPGKRYPISIRSSGGVSFEQPGEESQPR